MTVLGTVLGVCVVIYVINYVLLCMRPEMAMEIGFQKVGCPRTAHLLCFRTVKTVPVCMIWTNNVHVLGVGNCLK